MKRGRHDGLDVLIMLAIAFVLACCGVAMLRSCDRGYVEELER